MKVESYISVIAAMIRFSFKTAFRGSIKKRGYSLLNIFGLAIGITSAALILLWVEDELSWNDYFPNNENIFLVYNNQTYDGITFTFNVTPGPLAEGLKNDFPGVEISARSDYGSNHLFSVADKRIYKTGRYVDSTFFRIFKLKIVSGTISDAFSDLQTLVISENMAKQFFGNQNPIGQRIKVNNDKEFIVKAVYDDLPPNTSFRPGSSVPATEWFAPFDNFLKKNTWLEEWTNNGILTYVKLDSKTHLTAVNRKLHTYLSMKDPSAKFAKPFLYPMSKWHLYNKFFNGKQDGGRIQYVKLFTTIAWIILLIACINFMNLATARSEKKTREVGIRKVVGAERKTLVLHFISESVGLAVLAGLIALGLVWMLLPYFNKIVEKQLSIDLFRASHLPTFAGIILICGIVAGSYPAFYLSAFKPINILKGLRTPTGISAIIVRKALVILQFSISVILIICTILVYQQIKHAQLRELGYAKNQLIYLPVQGLMKEKFPSIKNELLATGVVTNAALSSSTILNLGSNTGDFTWEEKDPEKEVLITIERVSPEYIETMDLKLIKGRNFKFSTAADSNNIIINEALAKILGKAEILGTILRRENSVYTVVGVVKDHLFNNMYGSVSPVIFFNDTSFVNILTVRLKTGPILSTLNKVSEVFTKYNPGYPVDIRFVEDDFNRFFKSELLVGRLSSIFAILAIVISCLGLFGLAAYTTEQRIKEIGIRKVLGASVQSLVHLLSKDFAQLVLIACLIAFPVAWWYIYHWLENFEYRIEISIVVFIVAGFSALAIAILTVGLQAFMVARAKPVKNLRTE